MNSLSLFDMPDNLIPAKLKEIASHCGQPVAIILLLNFPGTLVRVPKTAPIQHRLADLLGLVDYRKLCENYGDEILQIPRAAEAIRAIRNQQILEDFAKGHKQSTIALKFGMTQRQVCKICNQVSFNAQLDLFA